MTKYWPNSKSLKQSLSYPEYKYFSCLNKDQCEVIARIAELSIDWDRDSDKKPGELLIKYLDRKGYSVEQSKQFFATALHTNKTLTYYKPRSKIAFLVANDNYEHLSKLITPSIDCDSLGANLRNLGFITISIRNTTSRQLKIIISKVIELIPEDSYCFIFYAGHGCEICNTNCLLGIDCPTENITFDHCVTQNWLLREVSLCKPELCMLIMDMCRICLDRELNPAIYKAMCDIEEYTIHSNLLIGYSTQSSKAAYEVLQIECSMSIDSSVTYELKTDDMEKIMPGASQYVNALCSRLSENLDVSTLLDKVHADVETCMKKQRPIKVQCGSSKRALYDPVTGDTTLLLSKIRSACMEFSELCDVS